MNVKLLLTLVIGAVLLAAPQARADQLISDNNVRYLDRHSGNIPVLRELHLDRRSYARINSVVLLASSRFGRGSIDLVINGQNVATRDLGRDLEMVQIPVNRYLGQDIRMMQIMPRGNIQVSMFGVTIEEDQYGPPAPVPPGPVPPTPYPPQPAPAADCKLSTYEVINYVNYHYVLRNMRNEVMAQSSSLDGIITEMHKLRRAGVCMNPEMQELRLTGKTVIDYVSYKNGLKLAGNDKYVGGYSNLNSLISDAKKLVDARLAYISPRQERCEIGGARVVDYVTYNYSLTQGNELLDYSGLIGNVSDTKNKLTEAGFCPRY